MSPQSPQKGVDESGQDSGVYLPCHIRGYHWSVCQGSSITVPEADHT